MRIKPKDHCERRTEFSQTEKKIREKSEAGGHSTNSVPSTIRATPSLSSSSPQHLLLLPTSFFPYPFLPLLFLFLLLSFISEFIVRLIFGVLPFRLPPFSAQLDLPLRAATNLILQPPRSLRSLILPSRFESSLDAHSCRDFFLLLYLSIP